MIQEKIYERKKMSRIFSRVCNINIKKGINGPDKQKWKETINEERKSLGKNQTWKIINMKKLKKE